MPQQGWDAKKPTGEKVWCYSKDGYMELLANGGWIGDYEWAWQRYMQQNPWCFPGGQEEPQGVSYDDVAGSVPPHVWYEVANQGTMPAFVAYLKSAVTWSKTYFQNWRNFRWQRLAEHADGVDDRWCPYIMGKNGPIYAGLADFMTSRPRRRYRSRR